MLKPAGWSGLLTGIRQPPSGGCVLKRRDGGVRCKRMPQPPSGGCVLKRCKTSGFCCVVIQPPSGGCVLKRFDQLYAVVGGGTSRLQAAVC